MDTVQLTFTTTPGVTAPTIDGTNIVVDVLRDGAGHPCGYTFPAPFEDLRVTQGDRVTAAFVARLEAALQHFAAQP